MINQHVMYKDILASRTYVKYPYYDTFNINDDKCLYCYRDNEVAMHNYLEEYATPDYIKNAIIGKIKESYEVSEEYENHLIKLFSSNNPSVRLTIYAGGTINVAKVFEDLYATNDIKRTFIELTGEINAIAMDGLFSLYASALYYLEGKLDSDNVKVLKSNYQKLIDGAYIYMKRGTAMEFFFMPIADIEKATDLKDVDMLMESLNNFTDVYLRNNGANKESIE